MDITYIPMARGYAYLAAVIDWFSRKVLAWKLSITLDTGFCIEAVAEALARYGKPEIFNTDQGSQFTSLAFTELLKRHEIAISMDGKGAWRDNVFMQRLWRSINYEEVYLRVYASVSEARASLGRYIEGFYKTRRPHSRLERQTPGEAYLPRCHQCRWRPNQGRKPLKKRPGTVQTNRAGSSGTLAPRQSEALTAPINPTFAR